MGLQLPLTHSAIVDEIEELTGLPRDLVEGKVRQETLDPCSAIVADAKKHGLDFCVYNEKMEDFYKRSDSFIFSLPVEFSRPVRQEILKKIKARVENYLARRAEASENGRINILMLGDGVGSDTLYLSGFLGDRADLYYFDVPGSRTFEFALKRFKKYGASVHVLTDYARIPAGFFDIVVSMEVLEHLPDPKLAIRQIADFLKPGGIALVTEFFLGVSERYPTHLRSNLRYSGRTPFLFLEEGMFLTYYSRFVTVHLKPMEFTKVKHPRLTGYLRILLDPFILFSLAGQQLSALLKRGIR